MLYDTMRTAGYESWTMKTHWQWHHANLENWDGTDIGVGNFALPCQSGDGGYPAPPLLFSELSKDVRKFPEGNDALDLTRMVCYAVEHPRDCWMYPTDYDGSYKSSEDPLR